MGLTVDEWLTIADTVLTIMFMEGLLSADLVLLVSLYIELGRGEEGKVTHVRLPQRPDARLGPKSSTGWCT